LNYFIAVYLIIFFNNYLFSWSTNTFTTSSDFSYFDLDGIDIIGSQEQAKLTLLNKFINLMTAFVPSERYSAGFAYSTDNSSFIVHGGRDETGNALNDLHIYNIKTNKWIQYAADKKLSGRYGHYIVYIGSDKFLLFGGLGQNGYFCDTWIYNIKDNSWSQKNYEIKPSSRAYFSMVFAGDLNRVFLFGGTDGPNVYNDLWYYDVINDSWSFIVTLSSPTKRFGHGISYDSKRKLLIVFGGQFNYTSYYDDLWLYNISSNTWTKKIKNNTNDTWPSKRTNFGFCYIESLDRTLLFGGNTGSDITNYSNEVWMYDYEHNYWSSEIPSDISPRELFSTVIGNDNSVYFFGGINNQGKVINELYKYVVRSSGTFISSPVFVTNNTTLKWLSISFPPDTIPSNTVRRIQISHSFDGKKWNEFHGWDGTENTYYEYAGIPVNIFQEDTDSKYLKVKGFLMSSVLPKMPEISQINITYNRSPYPPVIIQPKNNSRINNLNPEFIWNISNDDDNDTVITYKIQISTVNDFSNIYLEKEIIAQTSDTVKYIPEKELTTGKWFWRVYGFDIMQGPVSETFSFYIDTTPPGNVLFFNAYIGDNNGEIKLSWISPGDDGYSNNIEKGIWYVRYSTYSIINQQDWQYNQKNQRTGFFAASTGTIVYAVITGLADSTTYFFNIKLQDTAGNISDISEISPFAFTNAKPVVNLQPIDKEISNDYKISWNYYDPNPDDNVKNITLEVFNENYSNYIITGLTDKTTFYVWNTKEVKNGYYKIRIYITDKRNLTGTDELLSYFNVYNENEPPQITVIYPSKNSILNGKICINYNIYDPNLTDTHTVKIFVSSNSTDTYLLLDELNTFFATYYIWDTTEFPNTPNYKLKLIATDNYDAEAITYSDIFSVSNNNLPPEKFNLLFPENNSTIRSYRINFMWENKGDINGDIVKYELNISSYSNFSYKIVIKDIEKPEYFLEQLSQETTYYWKVIAYDWLGLTQENQEIFMFFTLSNSKAVSPDGIFFAEVLSYLPPSRYVDIEKLKPDEISSIKTAEIESIGNRLIKVISENVYNVYIFDILQKSKIENPDVTVKLTYKYKDNNNDEYYDSNEFIPVDNLKISYLNQNNNRWTLPENKQNIDKDKKYVSVIVNKLSLFTMVGSNYSNQLLSNINIYPNPFFAQNEILRIKYSLNEDSEIKITIYNLIGDTVKEWNFSPGIDLKSKGISEGYVNEVLWNGLNDNNRLVSTGMYMCIITAKSISGRTQREIKYIGVR